MNSRVLILFLFALLGIGPATVGAAWAQVRIVVPDEWLQPRVMTDAERAAAAEKEKKEKVAQQRQDAIRNAERDLRQRRIEEQAQRMGGPHRMAEARNLVRMEEDAMRAQGRVPYQKEMEEAAARYDRSQQTEKSVAPLEPAKYVADKGTTEPKCEMLPPLQGRERSTLHAQKDSAVKELRMLVRTACMQPDYRFGTPECTARPQTAPVVADGKIQIKKMPDKWMCSVEFACTKPRRKCQASAGGATAQ